MNLLIRKIGFVLILLALPLAANSLSRNSLTPVPEKPPAPEFELQTFTGVPISKADLKGKAVLVNFWATWCPPCREEMPGMIKAATHFPAESFAVVAINIGEDEFIIENFNDELDLTEHMTVLMDTDSTAIGLWNVRGLPTSFILDKQGRIVYKARGPRDFNSAAILELIQTLIDE